MAAPAIEHTSCHPASDPIQFRKALSRFTTGIVVITATSPNGPIGITANSFTSISLSPALVMWTPDKASRRHDIFVAAKSYAIHILSSHQQAIGEAFVRSIDAFGRTASRFNEAGVPILSGCLAVFECTQYACHDAGDHTIILGEVQTAHERPGDGLIFANGAFAKLPLSATAA